MKKRIIQITLLANLFILLFITQSCSSGTAQIDKEDNKEANEKPKNELSEEAQKLVGTWRFGHEPVSYDFKADGSFKEYSPAGSLEPEAPEEVYNEGKWALKEGLLTL